MCKSMKVNAYKSEKNLAGIFAFKDMYLQTPKVTVLLNVSHFFHALGPS